MRERDDASLPDLLEERFLSAGATSLIRIDDRWRSGREVLEGQRRHANALRALGLSSGDRLGVLLPNSEEFLLLWLAGIQLNLTLVPVNTHLVGEGLRRLVDHADLSALVLSESTLDAFREAFGERKLCRLLLVREADAPPGTGSLEVLLRAATTARPPRPPERRSDPALLIYTSGTTGLPKGVLLSRAAQREHALAYGRELVRLGPGETGYTCLPLFHVTSMGFTLGCLLGGARVVVDRRFDPFGFWDRIRRHRARMFPYVGAMIASLYRRPPRPDDACHPARRAIGAATPHRLWEPFERRFGVELIETYGQTELASLWFMPPPEGRRVGSVGKPVARMEVRLADTDGRDVVCGAPGEILVRPHDPLLMTQGYFRDPEATARAFREGWYHTGDAAVLAADGHYRFAGRLRDFIRHRGENVSALEVEQVALSHPEIQECAAVGIADELSEEEIKLCVVPVVGSRLTPEAVARYLNPRLARFMQPRYIEIRRSLPHTATQRVQKHLLIAEHLPQGVWDRRRRRI